LVQRVPDKERREDAG
jgi:hypothetical protein